MCRHSFEDDHYVEFSRLCQDRVIGTKDQVAHVSVLLPGCLCPYFLLGGVHTVDIGDAEYAYV